MKMAIAGVLPLIDTIMTDNDRSRRRQTITVLRDLVLWVMRKHCPSPFLLGVDNAKRVSSEMQKALGVECYARVLACSLIAAEDDDATICGVGAFIKLSCGIAVDHATALLITPAWLTLVGQAAAAGVPDALDRVHCSLQRELAHRPHDTELAVRVLVERVTTADAAVQTDACLVTQCMMRALHPSQHPEAAAALVPALWFAISTGSWDAVQAAAATLGMMMMQHGNGSDAVTSALLPLFAAHSPQALRHIRLAVCGLDGRTTCG